MNTMQTNPIYQHLLALMEQRPIEVHPDGSFTVLLPETVHPQPTRSFHEDAEDVYPQGHPREEDVHPQGHPQGHPQTTCSHPQGHPQAEDAHILVPHESSGEDAEDVVEDAEDVVEDVKDVKDVKDVTPALAEVLALFAHYPEPEFELDAPTVRDALGITLKAAQCRLRHLERARLVHKGMGKGKYVRIASPARPTGALAEPVSMQPDAHLSEAAEQGEHLSDVSSKNHDRENSVLLSPISCSSNPFSEGENRDICTKNKEKREGTSLNTLSSSLSPSHPPERGNEDAGTTTPDEPARARTSPSSSFSSSHPSSHPPRCEDCGTREADAALVRRGECLCRSCHLRRVEQELERWRRARAREAEEAFPEDEDDDLGYDARYDMEDEDVEDEDAEEWLEEDALP